MKALYGNQAPSIEQFRAVVYLWAITAPVSIAALLGAILWGKMHWTPLLTGMAGAAIAGVTVMPAAGSSMYRSLGEFYCFRGLEGGRFVLERACREADSLGFLAANVPKVGKHDLDVLRAAFAYTVDVRGLIMAVAGLTAGLAAGYLIRDSIASKQ